MQTIELSRRTSSKFAIFLLDLNDFKKVNDTLGHDVGDRLLQAIAGRLKAQLRGGDVMSRDDGAALARLGGDEFTILLNELNSADDAATVADRISRAMADPYVIDGTEIVTGVSIGISFFPDDGEDAEELLKHADTAMYHAKADKAFSYRFFAPKMQTAVAQRKTLEADLRDALGQDELHLCYQPIVALSDGKIVAFESFLRWTHPERGEVVPADFIPVAERSSLILRLGEFVLRTACRQLRRWHAEDGLEVPVSVNLSAAQIAYQDVLGIVDRELAESDVPPGALQVEVTEGLLLNYQDKAQAVLEGLRERGIKVYLDDFGTGFSSLSHLRRFPIPALKVDGTFVGEVATGREAAAIVRAIIAMAHALDMEVVAEAVETEAQRAFLKAEGCDLAQGYHCGVPMTADGVAALLRQAGRAALAAN